MFHFTILENPGAASQLQQDRIDHQLPWLLWEAGQKDPQSSFPALNG
jgi:hypothetical protein